MTIGNEVIEPMASTELSDFVIETQAGRVYGRALHLADSIVLLLSSTEGFRIGPIALAFPGASGMEGPLSTPLFGVDAEQMIVRVIAEQVSRWTGRPCLAIVSVDRLGRDILPSLMQSLKDHLLSSDPR